MEKKRKSHVVTIIICSMFALFLIAVIVWYIRSNIERQPNNIGEEQQVESSDSHDFSSHPALTKTERVGGLIPYNIQSDEIKEIPEEYFDELNDMSYDEIVKRIGEPSGTVGSGIVRDYWRIGEDRYAVWWEGFEIWNGED